MDIIYAVAILLGAYLVGSIPSGLLIVRMMTGQDVRNIESGRTGGTNVMRAAGFVPGLITALLDILKAAITVWVAKYFYPESYWLHVLAPFCAILGHNYSFYMVEKDENGKLKFRGGAGGAACVGGSIGLWAPSVLIVLPIGALLLYFLGYASVATLSVAIVSSLVFFVRLFMGATPLEYVFYGLLALIPMAWSLRPNIIRLVNGTERIVGFRAKKAVKVETKEKLNKS